MAADVAREALNDILVALQTSLLKQLAPVALGEDVVDFSMLTDFAEIGRKKTVEALWELHVRMANATSVSTDQGIYGVSTSPPELTPTTSLSPYSANDYGGFCEGAYYLQLGLHKDGVKLRNMSIAKTGEYFYFACRNSRCVFESPACKIRKEFLFDHAVRHYRGIRYRWAFLAKSHVALRRARSRAYDYRCIFCVLQGNEAPVISRIRPFLDHVAQHRGQLIDGSVLSRTLCITDRQATEEERFDINLPPLETDPSLRLEEEELEFA